MNKKTHHILVISHILIIVLALIYLFLPTATSSLQQNQAKEEKQQQSVTLQDKIDQLFIVGFRGDSLQTAPELTRILRDTNVGGIILFDYDNDTKTYDRNIRSLTQLQSLIRDSQALATTPLFISIDEEGGAVSRLKRLPGFAVSPSAEKVGTLTDTEVATSVQGVSDVLRVLGINMNFAPVLDVNVNPNSPAIGAMKRSFSRLQSVVSLKGSAVVEGLEKNEIISVGKHYPGHGSATRDSHAGFVDITTTTKWYEQVPFENLCKEHIPAIMIGHLYNAKIDAVFPATLSKAHIDTLKSLPGCEQVLVMSDDIDMKALSDQYSRGDILVNALNAGTDVLIVSNNISVYTPEQFFTDRTIVFDAVQKGDIEISRIEEAYEKVMEVKKEFGILPQ